MNTEPPTGDDLQQMLVSMKREVLTRADQQRPAPRRRARRAGLVIGVIAVLGIGATSGGVALGMIPQPFAAAPAPTPESTTVEPSETPSESSAPVVEQPTSTPTPTPTRRPFSANDPTTWTISFDEVGPVALGGAVASELDDLEPAFTVDPNSLCPNPDVYFYDNGAQQSLIVSAVDGKVFGITVGGNEQPGQPLGTGPTTAQGLGVGSTLPQLQAAYPDLERMPTTLAYGLPEWTVSDGSRHITFVLSSEDGPVKTVWVSTNPNPPYEYCG